MKLYMYVKWRKNRSLWKFAAACGSSAEWFYFFIYLFDNCHTQNYIGMQNEGFRDPIIKSVLYTLVHCTKVVILLHSQSSPPRICMRSCESIRLTEFILLRKLYMRGKIGFVSCLTYCTSFFCFPLLLATSKKWRKPSVILRRSVMTWTMPWPGTLRPLRVNRLSVKRRTITWPSWGNVSVTPHLIMCFR